MTEQQIMKAHQIALHYGKSKQRMQAVQELSELILVISRRPDQKIDRRAYLNDMIDEMADSLVMIEQMRQLYEINPIDIDRRITEKLNRQLKRIENEQEVAK